MKNKIKHAHFRRKLEYYLKGLIAEKYKLREVAVYTGYTIPHLSHLKQRYKKEGPQVLINGHKGMKVNRYCAD